MITPALPDLADTQPMPRVSMAELVFGDTDGAVPTVVIDPDETPDDPERARKDERVWDRLHERGETPPWPRPFGPSKKASPYCESGKRDYCTCDWCF